MGWEKLAEIGLPYKSHEAFRYVSLREFYLASFKGSAQKTIDKSLIFDAILPECIHSHLVFINGCLSLELSNLSALPSQTVVLSLDDAFHTHGSFLKNYFSNALKEESDPFALINLALHGTGGFLYLPPKCEVEPPLQCLHIVTGDEPMLVSTRLHLVLGSCSQMRCILTTKQLNPNAHHCLVPSTQLSIEEGAQAHLLNMVDTLPAWHFETVRATLKRNAQFNSLNFTFGGKVVRQSYRVCLKGENSQVNLNGLWMLKSNRTAHVHTSVEHEAPHTRSMQHFKGILNDHSQSSFEGKIKVAPQAQKTEAYQLNNNLILGQGAVANSKPNLEVFADDVKASHGATISQLSDEQLFYLTTRGIDPKTAKQLLISGFCREMIDKIPYDSLLTKLHANLQEVM